MSETGTATLPANDDNWAGEIALDVDMVSAACPRCSILLVEAIDADDGDLNTAVNYAAANADSVTNSYGSSEGTGDSDTAYDHAGILIAAASGDADWYNQVALNTTAADAQAWTVSYTPQAPNTPASMPTVLAVGGSMVMDDASSSRGYSDNVWSFKATNPDLPSLLNKVVYGGGSGCSKEFATPSFQSGLPLGSCAMRDSVDVAGPSDYTPVPAVKGAGGILSYAEGILGPGRRHERCVAVRDRAPHPPGVREPVDREHLRQIGDVQRRYDREQRPERDVHEYDRLQRRAGMGRAYRMGHAERGGAGRARRGDDHDDDGGRGRGCGVGFGVGVELGGRVRVELGLGAGRRRRDEQQLGGRERIRAPGGCRTTPAAPSSWMRRRATGPARGAPDRAVARAPR